MGSLKYLFVWTTKRKKPVLVNEIKNRLEEIITETLKNKNMKLHTLEVHPNHIRLCLSATPGISPHQITRILKSKTSRTLRTEFPELLKLPSLWTRKYLATTEKIHEDAVRKYIEKQPKN
ncbi:MAG: IS200/IS605 family transposase [Epsilonproteobacteria bacterium]|nr:MAG: IS200/IS605 family transposase [Campylobacterota bacterium]